MNLELSNAELGLLIRGTCWLLHAVPPSDHLETCNLLHRLLQLQNPNPVGGTAPAQSPAVGQGNQATPAAPGRSMIEDECQRDHWADVKADIKQAAVTAEIYIEKIDKMPPSRTGAKWITVTYPKLNGGKGWAWASVFDESLQPLIVKRIHQKTVVKLYVKGKYTNIVGVRA